MALIGQASEMSVGKCGIHDAYLRTKGRSFNRSRKPRRNTARRYVSKHVLMAGLAGSRIDYGSKLLVCVI
jgi:hypothetical protein